MATNSFPDVAGPLQMRVLEHLWKHGPATVHQVHDALNDAPSGKRAYTTILTVLRNLARRKLVEQQVRAKSHLFAPLVTRDQYRVGAARWFVQVQFAGDVKAAIAAVSGAR
jgi:BlaI family penicillinase repressor